MPRKVHFNGQTHDFPDDATDDEIRRALQATEKPAEKTLGGFASNAASSAGQFVKDVTAPIHSPVKTLEGVTGLFQGMAEKSGFTPANGVSHTENVDALMKHYTERYGSWEGFKNALYTDPVGIAADFSTLAGGVGAGAKGAQLAAKAGKLGKVAQVAGTVAKGAGEVAAATDPLRAALGATAGVVKIAGKGADAVSTGLTKSALRGGHSTNTPASKVANAVETANAEKVPFSQAGIDQVTKAIADLQQQKNARTLRGGQAGMTVDPKTVVIALDDLRDRLERQAFPKNDVRQIDAVIADFKDRHKGPISVDEAEALKEGTHANNRYGGKPSHPMQATEQAEKTVARVLKEELVRQIPELADLNAKQAKLLDLEGILRSAVNKHSNSGGFAGTMKSQLLTQSGALKTAGITGTGVMLGEPIIGGSVAFAHAILSDPRVAQRLAIAINKAQELNPAKWGSPSMKTAMARVASLPTPLSRVTQDPPQ